MELDSLNALSSVLGASGEPTVDGLADVVRLTGAGAPLWRGPFAVDDLAVSCVVAATTNAARFAAMRNGTDVPAVEIDVRHAAASFWTEALVDPRGWTMPPVWDPVAGDYRAADGWIRLHTNYRHHRAAALGVLGIPDGEEVGAATVADAVAAWAADDLEAAIVAAGGVAGRQRRGEAWADHPAGRAVRAEPVLVRSPTTAGPARCPAPAGLPFAGVRVLDLTRVLAGPTATGFLAAWGADVLRIDPPGFAEVPAILPVVTAAKRTARLDLASAHGRARFAELLADADVVVHGYRPGALGGLGLDPDGWHERRPGLVEVAIDAYGWSGPWAGRRGFDSIVQHSIGITARGAERAGVERPVALPCQALDHGAGWLAAAAAGAGLVERAASGAGSRWRTSLAAVGVLLASLDEVDALDRPAPSLDGLAAEIDGAVFVAPTAWGPLRRLSWPGRIGGCAPRLGRAGPLGVDAPAWAVSAG